MFRDAAVSHDRGDFDTRGSSKPFVIMTVPAGRDLGDPRVEGGQGGA